MERVGPVHTIHAAGNLPSEPHPFALRRSLVLAQAKCRGLGAQAIGIPDQHALESALINIFHVRTGEVSWIRHKEPGLSHASFNKLRKIGFLNPVC